MGRALLSSSITIHSLRCLPVGEEIEQDVVQLPASDTMLQSSRSNVRALAKLTVLGGLTAEQANFSGAVGRANAPGALNAIILNRCISNTGMRQGRPSKEFRHLQHCLGASEGASRTDMCADEDESLLMVLHTAASSSASRPTYLPDSDCTTT